MYPAARRSDHIDTFFGTPVPDPYRWMEDVDSPELKQWVDAQNRLTRSLLDPVPGRAALHARLSALTDFERVSAPTVRHGRFFFSHNSGLQNQAVLLWQDGPDGTPHVLLDPNTLSPDGTVAVAGVAFTDDGRRLAYALAEAGSDWITWHVRNIHANPNDASQDHTSQDLPDRITHSKFSGASWLPDGSGFFYAGYGLPTDQDEEPISLSGSPTTATPAPSLKAANFFHKVFFHALGTPQSADPILYERPDNKELLLGAHVTDDGRFLLLTASKGHTNQLHALPLSLSGRPAAPIIPIAPIADARYDPIDTDGATLWVHTTANAPNGRVVAIDLNHPDPAAWTTLIPETANNLESVTIVADTFLVTYLADAHSLLQLHTRSGQTLGPVDLPGLGTISTPSGRRSDTQSFFTFTNFTTPPTVLRLNLSEPPAAPPFFLPFRAESEEPASLPRTSTPATAPRPTLTPFRSPKLTFNPADFETRQIFATSKDGTRVPMFITGKRGLSLDGQNPTLLYGYGGFNISLPPAFSPAYLLWMELGGLYVQANLRGGGEYGELWHEAGTRLSKQNVFDDFIACAGLLQTAGYTSPAHLAIEGGSNGGLLVAAVLLQRPELFAAVVAHVGVFDMLRFDQFTIGYAWKPDYGSPSELEPEFRAILRYSPLHNVRPGIPYPPTLILTADHDDRVFPAHSFKFTAAMQHALSEASKEGPTPLLVIPSPSRGPQRASLLVGVGNEEPASPPGTSTPADINPTLIRVETRAGHGSGMPLSKRLDATIDVYLFLIRFLGISVALPESQSS